MNTQYPLLFGLSDKVVLDGFAAGVQIYGRALAEQDEAGAWWVYGVTPCGLADTGESLVDAVAAFRQRLRSVLYDYAAEAARDFEVFKREVECFFNAPNAELAAGWEAARRAVREGKLSLSDLPKDSSPRAPMIRIERLRLHPNENVLERQRPSLAA